MQLGPEFAPGSYKAWDYVARGAETFVLWLIVMAFVGRHMAGTPRRIAIAVCAYSSAEAFLRPACRLMLDMSTSPKAPAGLCSAAGFDFAWMAPVCLALIAYAMADSLGGKK